MTMPISMGAAVAALAGTEHDLGVSFDDVQLLNNYWEQVCAGGRESAFAVIDHRHHTV